MTSPSSAAFTGRYILVADEDPSVVAFVIRTLRDEGYTVFHAYDGHSAVELAFALRRCDLIISNTKVNGIPGLDLIRELRKHRPSQPIIYIANAGRSTPEIERQLPPDVPILREPFGADELRAVVAKVGRDSAKHRAAAIPETDSSSEWTPEK
jgi:DNA-binding response OmpR family regulator